MVPKIQSDNDIPKGIIFDLYGTLLKFDQRAFLVEMSTLFPNVERSIKMKHLKKMLITSFQSETDMYIGWCNAMGIEAPTDEQIEKCKKTIDSHISKITCYQGARSLLGFLKRRGYKLALLSNSAQAFIGPLITLELESFFEVISFSCYTGLLKPARNAYLSVCDDFHLTPNECLFIGDSIVNDFNTPLSIGMNAILIDNNKNGQHSDLTSIAFSFINGNLKSLIPNKIKLDSNQPELSLTQTLLLPDEQQGRYNLIGKICLKSHLQGESEFFCKRYLLPLVSIKKCH